MRIEGDPRRTLCLAALLAALLGGCAPLQGTAPEAPDVPAELPPPEIPPAVLSAPDGSVRPPAVRLLDEGRFTLTVQDADLRSVLLGFGRQSPLNVVVEPGVKGSVTADLEDVSLHEILEQVVVPRGYYYTVERNVLRVFASNRQTRTYRVDYPNYVRAGQSDLTITGAIASKVDLGAGGSAGGGEDISAAGVQTTQLSDFWTEVDQTLSAIVFGPEGEQPEASETGDEEGAPAPPRRRVLVSRQAALVTVTAEEDVLGHVERYLDEVSQSTGRQVLIDARILEVSLGDDLDLGLDLESAPRLGSDTAGLFSRLITPGLREATLVQSLAPTLTDGGFSFGFARNDLGLILQSLARQTDVRVVSTPRVTTLNNHKALIKVVRNEVFFVAEVEVTVVEGSGSGSATQFTPQIVPVGVTLDVTPHVSQNKEITMHIHPSVSEVVDVVQQPSSDPTLPQAGSLPIIDLRETDTVLRVADGQTIVIGGLIQSRELKVEKKLPIFGDLPLLGQLFRNTHSEEQRTELLILLTPTVLDAPRISRVSAEALDSLEELDTLRRKRSFEAPWWRRPFFESYGVR